MSCFAFNFTLMQALSIKNGERYAAEFELPLVFIMLYALHWITSLAKSRTYKTFLIAVILGFIVLSRIFYISQIKPTRFHALYNFIQQESVSFAPKDMIYIYPFSERSYNWYFDKNKNIINSSKDKYMYPEKPIYKYIFIDKEAKKRFPTGSRAKLFKYLKSKKEIYERKEDLEGFEMYMRNDEKVNIFINEENPLQ